MTLLLAMFGVGTLVFGTTGDGNASVPARFGLQPQQRAGTAASSPSVTPLPPARPVRIRIPTLDVSAPIMPLGLRPDGSLEVPPGAERAGWYTGSPTPGERGPAIIAAHINYNGEPGPFAELDTLTPGSLVLIDRADGSTARFRVTAVEQYDKDHFPTQQVYGTIDHPGLRLITCGGAFNPVTNNYEDNIVAYAHLATTPKHARSAPSRTPGS